MRECGRHSEMEPVEYHGDPLRRLTGVDYRSLTPELPQWVQERIRETADEVTAAVPLDGTVRAVFVTDDSEPCPHGPGAGQA